MIDLCVDLLAAQGRKTGDTRGIGAEDRFGSAALVARPSVTCCVQAVGTRKLVVVGERHLAHDLSHETCGVHGAAVRIPRAALDYGIGAVGAGRCVRHRTEDARVTKRARERTTIRIR